MALVPTYVGLRFDFLANNEIDDTFDDLYSTI